MYLRKIRTMKCKKFYLSLLASLILVPDMTSGSLFLSQQSEVKQVNDSLLVICYDRETGKAVSWRGTKNRRLGEKTHPQVTNHNYGTQLMFARIKKEDAGVYTCKTDIETAEFTLFVEDPIDFVDTPSEQDGQEGKDVVIRCEAHGATLTWLVDGETPKEPKYKVMGDGLLVHDITKDDDKTYICKAVSETSGTMKDQPIHLRVIHEPRLPPNRTDKHYVKEEVVYGYLGGVVNLTCEVEAEPQPTIQWFDRSGRKNKKIGEEIEVSPYKSVLMLIMTKKTMGEYKCTAENEIGTLEIFFKVLNGTQPNPPTSIKLKGANSNVLSLEIEGPEPIEEDAQIQMEPQGYKVIYRPIEEENITNWMEQTFSVAEDNTYALTDLRHDTEYEVRAATHNRAGLSDFTNTSIFKTLQSTGDRVSSNMPCLVTIALSIFIICLDLAYRRQI